MYSVEHSYSETFHSVAAAGASARQLSGLHCSDVPQNA